MNQLIYLELKCLGIKELGIMLYQTQCQMLGKGLY